MPPSNAPHVPWGENFRNPAVSFWTDRPKLFRPLVALAIAGLVWLAPAPARAGEALIAVAANFTAAANELGTAFTTRTGHHLRFSFGSTGKLFAQIAFGAPFDAFLAADAARPAKAEAEGLAVPGSRFTYAVGRLALMSADPTLVNDRGTVLATGTIDRLALANPRTAPYGAAAVEVLRALGVYDRLRPALVQGDTVAQTLQFVMTGNVGLGFVARAQVVALGDHGGSVWLVPPRLHGPIRQDAVLLSSGADTPAATAFLAFLRSAAAAEIVTAYGYLTE